MISTRLSTEEQRRGQLDEDIASLEAQMFGTEQEEKVLDGDNVIAPEGPTDPEADSTEEAKEDVIVLEDTRKPDDEVGELRKQLADATHRYNRYKGSTDQTIFQLRKDLASVADQNAKLKEELKKAALTSSQSESGIDSAFTQDVVDILGEDAVNAIKTTVKAAQEKADRLESQMLDKDIEKSQSTSEELLAQNQRDFMAKLVEYVPDVAKMDADPGFNDWLRQAGPDGVERLKRLRADQDNFDAWRVAQFFLEYKELSQEKSSGEVKDSVDSHIGPKGTQSASSNNLVDQSKQGWVNQSEIDKFNEDVARGVYKYDSAKAEAMEAKIFKAMNAGKINFNA